MAAGNQQPIVLRTVLWISEHTPGVEYAVLARTTHGYRAQGAWIGVADGAPGRARYRLDLDAEWGVRRLRAAWSTATARARLRLDRDAAGGWLVDGRPRPDLAACTDCDLAWTPLTNTLPIRRLGLAIGQQRAITAAYVAPPQLTVTPDEQRYTRLAEQRWRYESLDSDFVAELTVDEDGLVLEYPPLFRRAATAPPAPQ